MTGRERVVSYRHYMLPELLPLLDQARQLSGSTNAEIINEILKQQLPTFIEAARSAEGVNIELLSNQDN